MMGRNNQCGMRSVECGMGKDKWGDKEIRISGHQESIRKGDRELRNKKKQGDKTCELLILTVFLEPVEI
jgi:hypothetical protein